MYLMEHPRTNIPSFLLEQLRSKLYSSGKAPSIPLAALSGRPSLFSALFHYGSYWCDCAGRGAVVLDLWTGRDESSATERGLPRQFYYASPSVLKQLFAVEGVAGHVIDLTRSYDPVNEVVVLVLLTKRDSHSFKIVADR